MKIQKLIERCYVAGHSRVAGLAIFKEIFMLENIDKQAKFDSLNWFCTALRKNKPQIAHYLDDMSSCGLENEERAQQHFFNVLGVLVNDLNICDDVKEVKIIMSALKWRFMSRDHDCLQKLNIFDSLHKKSPKLKTLWGKPVAVEISLDGSDLANEMLDLFDMLYMTILKRIIESDVGSNSKLSGMGQMARAKSVVRESSASPLFNSVFTIIFSEMKRYIDILEKSKGIDWAIYSKQRSQIEDLLTLEKPEGKDSKTPSIDDILLLDKNEEFSIKVTIETDEIN